MWTYIPPLDQEHHQKKLKEDITIPYSYYGSHNKDQSEDSRWSYHGARDYPIGAHTVTQAKPTSLD